MGALGHVSVSPGPNFPHRDPKLALIRPCNEDRRRGLVLIDAAPASFNAAEFCARARKAASRTLCVCPFSHLPRARLRTAAEEYGRLAGPAKHDPCWESRVLHRLSPGKSQWRRTDADRHNFEGLLGPRWHLPFSGMTSLPRPLIDSPCCLVVGTELVMDLSIGSFILRRPQNSQDVYRSALASLLFQHFLTLFSCGFTTGDRP